MAVDTQANEGCFHCGLPVPPDSDFTTVIDGEARQMCCPGCQAVAQTIVGSGLDTYYRHRTETASSPEITGRKLPASLAQELALYDQSSVQRDFVTTQENLLEASLVIEGITCAACVWLLEHHLQGLTGIEKASVNLTSHRARIQWNPAEIALSTILTEIYRIGYQAHPWHPNKEEELLAAEQKRAMRRLGIAGIGMMQVMMMATALYAGAIQGLETEYQAFIRWTSWLIATPVVFYSARPFFTAALRDLRTRQLSMDVPVSLAIGGAYLASVWATISNTGEIYYDSVTMFTFFLLIGRFLEMKARHRSGKAGNAMLNLLPTSALRLADGVEQLVPANELNAGDLVRVRPGQTVPADGIIEQGHSSIDESALTGEYLPIQKLEGEAVVGGTINVENPILIRISEVGAESRLSAIVRLLDRAAEEKPQVARLADRVSSYFVAAVLVTATIVGGSWYMLEPANALWITLSVLVVTCPCALSLATPTALTAATGTLRQHGFLITRGHVLESLARATHIIFDKTGTLTEGNLSLQSTQTVATLDEEQCLELAAALEAHSEHPIAKAFHPFATSTQAEQINVTVGQGIEGLINNQRYRIGTPEFAAALCTANDIQQPAQEGKWLLLCDSVQPLAWFRINDQLRREARDTIAQLHALGLQCEMLTGDNSHAVEETAEQLGITAITRGVSPEQKLAHVAQLQAEGAEVIMVGDGINDIPVLAGAQTSIAMGSATDLAKTNADAVLISSDLQRLVDAIQLSRRSRQVIRQNLSWALCYNLLALPLAALGFVAPWMAAIGMSASSLVVVGNALRLSRLRRRAPQSTTHP